MSGPLLRLYTGRHEVSPFLRPPQSHDVMGDADVAASAWIFLSTLKKAAIKVREQPPLMF